MLAGEARTDPPLMNDSKSKWRGAAIAVGLAVLTLAVYGRATTFRYINYDDPLFITNNEIVQQGLTWQGLRYAFTTFDDGNYIPLTWLTQLAVVEVAGTGPAWAHLANALLHAAAVGLLFVFLRRATGAAGRSAVVAGLFALHPLHVESVAWVSERKDVLAAFFWVLGLIAYDAYVRRWSGPRYLVLLAVFAACLLSKPMAVTFPCVLLLLDVWPYGRVKLGLARDTLADLRRVVIEKIPLFAFVAAAAAVTVYGQRFAGSLQSGATFPIGDRVLNALSAYAIYIAQTFWPARLAVFYPWLEGSRLYAWAGAGAVLLLGVTAFCVWQVRRWPYLLVGWLWFAGTLLPVIGLVQVGAQAHADRYTYLPHIGLFIALVWLAADALAEVRVSRVAAGALAGGLCVACAVLTWRQVGYWLNSETLFRHALAVTDNNRLAHSSYGQALYDRGDLDGAEAQYREAIAIDPRYWLDYHNLGLVLLKKDRPVGAARAFRRALDMNPDAEGTWALLGNALAGERDYGGAVRAYRRSLNLDPGQPHVLGDMGAALNVTGHEPDAEAAYRKALALAPEVGAFHYNLALSLMKQGRVEEACRELEATVSRDPDNAFAYFHLVPCRFGAGDTESALDALERAVSLDPSLKQAAQRDPRFQAVLQDARFRRVAGVSEHDG